ncbi:copper resistance protein B [Novosphingobium sp. FGD1]|jgi:copper resistance protein B|uniref:Copper resistance protein B n=1 Tax=Novosphingobium silvae TaxID=2692619 RepID=A0A7X4GGT4_9SPHN|nr:copper resistance protein B [Novosphingobium silvae]MYL98355.1 copper resistance protein B [Novosphingobium silvae]
MRRRTSLLAASLPMLAAATPIAALAQDAAGTSAGATSHAGMDHSTMDHSSMDHSGMSHSMPDPQGRTSAGSSEHGHDAHAGHVMPSSPVSDKPGDAPAPPVPTDHSADAFFAPDRMEASRGVMLEEMRFSTFALQVDRLEYRAGKGRGGFGWDWQAWYSGDIDRVVLESEGEGTFGQAAERIELNAFWRHGLDPWFNLQMGVRHDFRPDPQRTYALLGIEGLAPYWFELEGQLLVSDRGDVHARGKAAYQQRITQSVVLEPELEVDMAMQDVPELQVGAGFERLELGGRLRYERNRSLAPYVGVHWERKLGKTARLARSSGENASGISAVFGMRAMF